VQSANATNSDSDRTALQSEVAQLVAEIDRVAQKTTFNGIALLDGTFTSKTFQVGADAGSTVSISSIDSVRTSALGGSYSVTATGTGEVSAAAISADSMYVNGILVGATTDDTYSVDEETFSALAKANALNAVSASTGVTATASTAVVADQGQTTGDGTGQTFLINNVLISYDDDAALATQTTNILTAVNDKTDQTGVVATASGNTITLTASDGRNITLAENGAGTGLDIAGFSTADTYRGTLTLTSGNQEGILVSDTATGVVNAAQSAILGWAGGLDVDPDAGTSGVAISSLSVTTAANATEAITSADNALSTINSIRATLGSYQSRFESVVANLQTTAENLSASRSRIMDADFASETANLTKAQILQQSGIAMLAQANAIPQNVLALLQ
jgi:flagellin